MATYEELKQRAKQKREEEQEKKSGQTTTPQTTSGTSSYEELKKKAKQKREEERTKVVDSSYISSFIESANKYFSSVQDETGKVGWGNASTAYQNRQNTWNDLDQKRSIIRSWLDLNKSNYPEEDYNEFAAYLDALGNDATSVLDWFKGTKDFYSQWETEDQYNFWESRNTTEERQQLYTDNQSRIKELEDAYYDFRDLEHWYSGYQMNPEAWDADVVSENLSRYNKYKSQYGTADKVEMEMAQLKADNTNYERGNRNQYGQDYGNKVIDDYAAKYLSNPEFLQAAANREYGNPTVEDYIRYNQLNDPSTWSYDVDGTVRASDGTVIVDDGRGNMSYPGNVSMNTIRDPLGMYLSASEEERLIPASAISGQLSNVMMEGSSRHWELLTEDELNIYYGLLAQEGRQAATEFLATMQNTLDMRFTYRDIDSISQMYDEADLFEKIMMNAATVPANVIGSVVAGMEDAIALASGNDINPYSNSHAGMHYAQTVRGKTQQEIDANANPDALLTWGDVYQAGMSLGDSLLAMGIGGKAGSILLGTSAAESEAYRLYQQGASKEQIAAGAALAGGAEMFFEWASIDKLINMKDATSLLQYVTNILTQAGIEGSEEMATEIANAITNAIVMRSQSDWQAALNESGNDVATVLKQKVLDVIHAGISGAISGGISGFSASTISGVATMADYGKTGKEVMRKGDVEALRTLAMEMSGSKGSLARQASRMSAESATGKGIGKVAAGVKNFSNNVNVGRVANKVGEKVTTKNISDIKSALGKKGITSDKAEKIAAYLHKVATGGILDYVEAQEVASDQRIVDVLRDVVANPESSVGQRTMKMVESLAGKAPTASTASETAPKGNTSTGAGVPTETSYSVSEGGQTKLDGNVVQIRGLHELDDGTTVVATADGQTADPSEVEYSHKGQALVFEAYSNLKGQYSNPVIANMPVADRSALAMGYDPASGMDGRLYVVGSNEAYWYGYEGISLNTLPTSSFAKHLSQEQITRAYALGRATAEASAKAQSESVQAAYEQAVEKLGGKEAAKAAVKKAGKVILEHGITESSMTKQQRASFKMTQAVASTSGTTVHVYRGGKERGYYDPNTGDVWLNINADANAQSYAVFTLGHELVHKAKDLSAAKFKKFADTLLEKYGEKGISVEALIQAKIKQYADYDITLDEHAAWEEVIADACQAMLLDTNAVETMAEFRDANPGFWQKIVDTIKEFIEKIRLALKGVEPDSEEAHHFKELDAAAQKILENLFVDMVMDASQKGAVIKAANGTLSVEQHMETKDIKYNLAAVNKHKSNLEAKYSEESTVPLVTLMARYNKIIDIWTKLGGELNSQFLKDWDSKVGTDRTFTIFKAQSGYKYNVELSSMCKKGVPLFEAIDTIVKQEVMKELGIETLGKAEKEILYDILKSHHFEIPCAICYVEQARQREGAIIDAFLNGKVVKNASGKTTQFKLGWNEVLDAIESEMRANGVEYSFAQVSRDLATEAYAPANLDMDEKTQAAFFEALKKIANREIARYNKDEKKSRSLLSDVTPEAVKACFKGTLPSNLKIFKVLFQEPSSRFKIQHDLLYSSIATQNLSKAHHELYGLFNSQGGVSGYKTKQGTTIYWGDILSKSWTPDTLRKEGGVRNQSNSDFQIYTLLDQAQMYIDFTAKGYYLQAYTKVLSELKLFGLSRGKINASLIPRVVVYHNADGSVDVERTMATAGLDEKGNPIYDDIEGINHAEAFMLIADPEYSKSITGICIGYSDAHIRKLLDVDGVQLIIGFHDKTDDGEKRYRGARYAKNYNGLNEAVKYDAEGKPKTVHIGFNPYVKKAEGRFRYNEETETFEGTTTFKGKEYTADDIPRLAADMYLDMCEKKGYVPAYADFKDHRNYYKLLADFGLYDSQGHYAPHRKVAYNMPDQVPYLDANGNKQYMKSYDYIREELRRELIVRDDISAALADQSSEGIIPQFKAKVEEMRGHTIPEGAKRSMPKVSDSEYMAAVSRGDMEAAQRMVDAAARAAGFTSPKLYHGTSKFGFTVFDPAFSDDKMSIFMSSSNLVAETYSGKTKKYRVFERPSITPEALDSASPETILKLLQENVDSNIELVSEQERDRVVDKSREKIKAALGIAESLPDIMGRRWTGKAQDSLDNIISYLKDMLAASTYNEFMDAHSEYEGYLWAMRWDDEKAADVLHSLILDDMLDAYRGMTTYLNNTLFRGYADYTKRNGDEFFTYNDALTTLYKVLFKGVYQLYTNPGKQLVIDAEGGYWNQIRGKHINASGTVRTRDVAKYAKENGYDSVLIKNLHDSGDYTYMGQSDVYIFFGGERLKSADPVTYDDSGKVIPLSERFNRGNKDIRYSMPKTSGREARIADTQAKVTARYRRTVDKVLAGTYNSRDNILMGYTPDIFVKLGMPSLPFVIGPGHVYTSTVTEAEAMADPLGRYKRDGHYHGLGVNAVKNLYTAMQDPIMIIAAKDTDDKKHAPRSLHSVVAIVDVGNAKKHLLLPVELTVPRIVGGRRMDVNVLSSAYERTVENLVIEAVAQMNTGDVGVYYAKKEAIALLSGRVSFPKQLTAAIASNGIVHRFGEKVNMAIADVTQSLQFTSWFGDWQNDPGRSSKVVNDDGTPMVVYHGTKSGNIKTFRTTNVQGTGGLFLSTSRSVAEGFAGADGEVYESYVNIRRPFVVDANLSFYDSIDIPDEMKGSRYAFGNTVDTNAIAAYAREAGYDGVIIRNVREPSGFGDDIIAFAPEQVKSVDNIGIFDKTKRNSMYKVPNSRGLSSRQLLADAFEEMVQTPQERQMIDEYRVNISKVEDVQERLKKVRAKIHELTVSKGDKSKIAALNKTASELAALIDSYDRKLLEMEGSKPLRDVLTRAKQAAYRDAKQRGEKLMAEYRQQVSERFDRGVESRKKTAMRAKIRKTIRDLDKILNRGDKKRNVKEGMKGFVEEALASAEILFTENYGNEDMIRNGVEVEMTPEEEKYMTEARAILAELYNLPSGSYEAWAERQGVEESLKSKLAYRMGKLKDVFYRERLRLNKTKVADVLSKLADAYAKLETSEYAYVSGAYNEAIHQYLKTLQEEVGGATIRDMSLNQLELMHTAYTMVLHSVRKANEMFTEGWTKRRDELANGIMFEVKDAGGVHGRWSAAEVARNRASWNNTKPIYAAERIGSETFKQLWAGLFKGQYNWAVDMEEAKAFRQKLAEKYGVKNWDMEKLYTFTSASGLKFQLNLNQIMSIYAYSKREQAHDHLTKGGFVFGKDTEVIVNKHGIKVTYYDRSATAYKLSDELVEDIVSMLDTVPGAKQFVDEMQDYLSTTMGEKGNEVSMKLYGVKLFNEAFYFPLRSAGQYMERAKEADLKKQQGQVSIVNSSFTHATKPKANNPVVLEGFMDVWASHVNEMSMYHSMVLPMEDFRRVYNYSSPNMEGQDSVSVNSVIENAYGPEATGYIDQLYKELNGGAVTDPRETAFKERIGKFKKAAVMLSSSVVVQQFSAIGRAYALIDPKYFIGAKVDKHRQAAAWEEMKRYAPVAIIKEMGGFDTHTGGSAKDYLLAEEYGKGERISGLIKDEQYRSEIMGWAPAKADELTWCAIWEAVKRETKAKHPELDVKSEEFLKAAGERFSEVIEKTQVYDSVLARSANMRSKNGLMQMATAFMAEPTTTVNMIEDALRKKDKKYIARTFASVFASIVINNALASIVYAMRDDDDDETFLEKYTQALVSGMLDDLNPMTYYPFLKDVWSLLQGYDVERSDMSVVSDVTDAVKRLATTFAKFDEDMDEEEMAEYYKEIGTGLMGLLDAGCTALGIPEKNVRREITAIVNTFKTFSKTFGSTTWNSFVDAIGSSALDSIPIVGLFGGESRTDKLYDAIVSGDSTYLARLKAGYKSEDSYNAAVRKALRENDPRIHQAALAGYNGDPSERVRIARLIIADGFSQDNVVAAINAEINNMKPDEPKSDPKAKGFYTAEDFAREIANGDQAAANAAKVDVIQTAQKNGKSAEEATKSFVSSAKSELKDLFLVGRISEQKAINALTTYCDMDEADAIADVQYWAFKNDYPDVFVDDQWFDTYYEKIADSGIEIDVYMEYRNAVAGITGENKKSGRMSVINSLPITSAQKDALYLAEGWAASKLNEAPWH